MTYACTAVKMTQRLKANAAFTADRSSARPHPRHTLATPPQRTATFEIGLFLTGNSAASVYLKTSTQLRFTVSVAKDFGLYFRRFEQLSATKRRFS
jgi:hypothetical protein